MRAGLGDEARWRGLDRAGGLRQGEGERERASERGSTGGAQGLASCFPAGTEPLCLHDSGQVALPQSWSFFGEAKPPSQLNQEAKPGYLGKKPGIGL